MSGAAEGQRLSDRQRLAWLRLIRSENVGPLTFRDLVNRFGSADAALDALPDLVRRGGGSPRICTSADASAEIDTAARFGATFVAMGEPGYPPLLRQIHAPPPLLAVKGQLGALELPGVAIVGARNASIAGIRFARGLARDIGAEGYAVVSGLARGIDAAAHAGSMDTGTIAAMAGGLDRPYPPEHAELAAAIAGRGALISEMPFGWEPRARDFPRRNRLIAGLSHGLVVIEAALRSGSLISARLAGEFGRLVFAVPGSPLDPRSAGTNGLLKDGAILVTEAADVLSALAPQSGMPLLPAGSFEEPTDLAAAAEPGDGERGMVLEALSQVPTGIDEIVRHTGLHPAQVQLVLLELQLAGRLERHSGGAVSLLP
jgi:DNA processing protein